MRVINLCRCGHNEAMHEDFNRTGQRVYCDLCDCVLYRQHDRVTRPSFLDRIFKKRRTSLEV